MIDVIAHRCRLFEYIPYAIHGIAASTVKPEIAVSRSNGNIEIWSVSGNCFPKMVIPGSGSSIEALQWVGSRLISGGINGDLIEYNLSCGTIKLSVDSFGGAVWCLCASPDQSCLAAGCEDGSVKLFNLENDTIKYERSFDRQEGRILSIAWHNEGDVVVTGSVDIIRLWSSKTGHAIQKITIDRLMNNVATIVWSVIILNDYTVISGDSSGKVGFWNGMNGTLLKSFHIHRADVLCMCLGKNENFLYTSGVDAKAAEFVRISPSDPTSWVQGKVVRKQTHDIRALASNGEHIFSGGVDTFLVRRSLSNKIDNGFKILSFPSRSIVSVSKTARLMLFQYSNYLELWSVAKSSGSETLEPGVTLPVEKPPVKLIRVNKPSSDNGVIKCSALSPCGRYLAYSTSSATRMFCLGKEDDQTQLKVFRVRCSGLTPANAITFTPNSGHMIVSTTNHRLLFVKAVKNEARLYHAVSLKSTSTIAHLLASSSDSTLVASANLDGEVNVFDIVQMNKVATLPQYQQIPTAMSFVPESSRILIAYADMQVLEYDLTKEAYTPWTKHCITYEEVPILRKVRKLPKDKDIFAVVSSIFHMKHKNNPSYTSFFVSSDGIYVVEKLKSSKEEYDTRFMRQLFPLLHADVIEDQTLLVVERPAQAIFDQLPPTLQLKKFGV